jgi:hypothetical protein
VVCFVWFDSVGVGVQPVADRYTHIHADARANEHAASDGYALAAQAGGGLHAGAGGDARAGGGAAQPAARRIADADGAIEIVFDKPMDTAPWRKRSK